MSTVTEIKQAISKLSPREYCELLAELFPSSDDEWDRQMKADATSGKLDFIDRDVSEALQSGTSFPLERILGDEQ